MFAVEIKTSVPWFVRSKMTPSNQWIKIAEHKSLKEAEKEVSWAQAMESDYKNVVSQLSIECRISSGGKTVWVK